MADFDFDPTTNKGTIWLRRGGIVSRSTVVNLQTQNFDIQGQLISVDIPNVLGTINLSGIPITTEEHDHIRDHLLRSRGSQFKSGG